MEPEDSPDTPLEQDIVGLPEDVAAIRAEIRPSSPRRTGKAIVLAVTSMEFMHSMIMTPSRFTLVRRRRKSAVELAAT